MVLPWFWALLLWWNGCHDPAPVLPKREFRAVWVTTKHNIDWPSRAGLPPEQQREEFVQLLDRLQANGVNAVVVQVRPAGDAFYPSRYAPWSEWLSGRQGQAPVPYYDPLAFMIEAAHARHMEFHAWLNPFRAISHIRFSSVDSSNLARRAPDWTFLHGQTRYFDPGLPEVRAHLTGVVMELVRGYDLDGLHFDDYFYPYPEAGATLDDARTFARYGEGFTDRNAWRRHNIDTFISTLSDSLRATAPRLKFGISPVGIWRNRSEDPLGSNSRAGQTSYDGLHADVRRWLQEGWIDYVAPQLYWSIVHPYAPYGELLPWWASNAFGRHVYVGHALFKLEGGGGRHWHNPSELQQQLRLTLGHPEVQGSIFFSANAFLRHAPQVETLLRRERYRLPALIPPMPWKDSIAPLAPRQLELQAEGDRTTLRWQPAPLAADGDSAWGYVVYRFRGQGRIDLNDPGAILAVVRDTTYRDWGRLPGQPYTYLVTALDRLHNESQTAAAAYLDPEAR